VIWRALVGGDELVRPEAVEGAPREGADRAIDGAWVVATHDVGLVVAAVAGDALGSAGVRFAVGRTCTCGRAQGAAAGADLVVGIGHNAGDRAGRAQHAVIAAAVGHIDPVSATPGTYRGGAAVIDQTVAAGAAPQPIKSGSTVDQVASGAPVDLVLAGVAVNQVLPGAALEQIACRAAVDQVAARAAQDAAGGTSKAELVVVSAADDPLLRAQPQHEVRPPRDSEQLQPIGRGHLCIAAQPSAGIEPQ
jgi:hypothetical protein